MYDVKLNIMYMCIVEEKQTLLFIHIIRESLSTK